MKREIGGYFELELARNQEYHPNAIKLNTGRNALEYILRAKKYRKVYLPYYTCEVILEPIHKLRIDYRFYSIDKKFQPIFDYSEVEPDAVFLYTNYFGLCDNTVSEISKKCKNLVVDYSQSFFSKPVPGIDTFYSPRKFFGVPDGAYLYTDQMLNQKFGVDISYKRLKYLLGRTDLGAEQFYSEFKKVDESFTNQPIKYMSKLTQRLLSSIGYQNIAAVRNANFDIYHKYFTKRNQLSIQINPETVPMVYPFLTEDDTLREKLIENKIFVARYWPNVLEWCENGTWEYDMAKNMVPLPVDQRYGVEDMQKIVSLILK